MSIRHSGLVKSRKDNLYSSRKGGGNVTIAREDIGTTMIKILDLKAELRSWEAGYRVRP